VHEGIVLKRAKKRQQFFAYLQKREGKRKKAGNPHGSPACNQSSQRV